MPQKAADFLLELAALDLPPPALFFHRGPLGLDLGLAVDEPAGLLFELLLAPGGPILQVFALLGEFFVLRGDARRQGLHVGLLLRELGPREPMLVGQLQSNLRERSGQGGRGHRAA